MSDVSVLGRFGEIINLFREDMPLITLEQVLQRLDISDATAYRYLSTLSDLGFLSKFSGGYTIGPKVMELNFLVSQYDPLISASRSLIRDLAQQTRTHVLIAKVYGMHFVNVEYAKGEGLDKDLNFVPGRKLPTFRGSQARAILSVMEKRRLRKLYDAHPADPDRDAIGKDWKSFCKALLRTRKEGHYVSRQELDLGVHGIAAPVFDSSRDVLGSLVVAYRVDRPPTMGEANLAILVKTKAAELADLIAAS